MGEGFEILIKGVLNLNDCNSIIVFESKHNKQYLFTRSRAISSK